MRTYTQVSFFILRSLFTIPHTMIPLYLSCLIFASLTQVKAFEPTCPIIFDGRVPPTADVNSFDRNETPYSGLRAKNMKWSSLVTFPQVPPAIFDYDFGGKPIAIEINQDTVIRPANKPHETGQRQTTLKFRRNQGSDEGINGALSRLSNCFLED